MPSSSIGISFSGDGSAPVSVKPVQETDAVLVADIAIAASVTNHEVDLSWLYSKMKGILMWAEGAGLTVKTNSSGSPDQTFACVVGVPALVWQNGAAQTNPITADVTKLYVTNGTATAATLRLRVPLAP